MDLGFALLLVLLPLLIYILARVASSAYFKSKHDYLKKVMNHDDPPPNDK